MIRVGIIGGIGSGKSFISRLFGYPVFNADDEVKFIYKKNKECFNKLKKKLPRFIKTFPIKKKEIISSISSNKKNLKIISSIVHPLVRKKMKKFITINKKSEIIILDIPLLIENRLNKKKDIILRFFLFELMDDMSSFFLIGNVFINFGSFFFNLLKHSLFFL